MNSKSQASRGTRRNRKLALHPATRAIRHALALSLAVAASQPVLAGNCDANVQAAASLKAGCIGDARDARLPLIVHDLTMVPQHLVEQNPAFTTLSIVAATGDAIGIDAWDAYNDVSVLNEGVIDVATVAYGVNALGIRAGSIDGDVSVNNAGDISAVTGGDVIGRMDVYGIYATSGTGDVSVVNTGTVTSTAGGSVSQMPYVYAVMNGVGIAAITDSGDISIDNAGALVVSAPGSSPYGSSIFGIVAHSDSGDIAITNAATGSLSVDQPYGYANGISAYSHSGAVRVDNAGTISVGSAFGASVAIAAQNKYGTSPVAVTNSGDLDVSSYSAAIGITVRAASGTASVDNTGGVDVQSMHAGAATGISAQSKYADTTLTNAGSIDASSLDTVDAHGTAIGISALTVYGGDVAVDNTGSVTSGAYAASGIVATAKYDSVAVVNGADGMVSVDGVMTTGIDATAKYDGDVSVDNAGHIVSNGRQQAVGIYANTMADDYGVNPGTVSISNTGTIEATSSSFLAFGVFANGYNGTSVSNAGDITATGYYANGVVARDVFGGVQIDNTGSIVVHAAGGDATGVVADTIYEAAVITNAGQIAVDSNGRAIGAIANSAYGSAEIINTDTGTITADAVFEARGAVMYGIEVARLTNSGDIVADAHSAAVSATAYGSIAAAGISVTLNYGSIGASATVDGSGDALAFGALGYGNAVTMVNEGSIASNAAVGAGQAVAFGVYAYSEYNASYNYGDIAATATSGAGDTFAYGLMAIGVGGTTAYNAADGTIAASATTTDGNATSAALNAYGFYGSEITNDGALASTTDVSGFGYSVSAGVLNFAMGDAIVANAGTIDVVANVETGLSDAKGIDNLAVHWVGTVDNTGGIDVTAGAITGYAYATGIRNTHYEDAGGITNSGDITATATTGWGIAEARGVDTLGLYGTVIANTGTISAIATADRAYAHAFATRAYGGNVGATTQNDGTLSAVATAHDTYAYAVAIGAQTLASTFTPQTLSTLVNHGDIAAAAIADGDHGFASAMATGTAAKYAATYNDGDILAMADSTAMAFATGAYTSGWNGAIGVNGGTITAQATAGFYANAKAIVDDAYNAGDASTTNGGDVHASALVAGDYATGYGGVAYAFGTTTNARYTGEVLNTGSITAVATAPFGLARAVGTSMDSKKGTSTLRNDGTITASANAYHYAAVATGADLEARFDATTTNYGTIGAQATADFSDISAWAVGSSTSSWGIAGNGMLANHGDIFARANADSGNAYSVGAGVRGTITASTINAANIVATSDAAAGLAIARGAYTVSSGGAYYGSVVSIDNQGIVSAQANADAGLGFAYGSVLIGEGATTTNTGTMEGVSHAADGTAVAVGSLSIGSTAGLDNAGAIHAIATASGNGIATATGAVVTGDFAAYENGVWYFYASTHNVDSHAYNAGDITAFADAGTGVATSTGLVAHSAYGSVAIDNAGDILAVANGGDDSVAYGVHMVSAGGNTLSNTGSIVAAGTNATHIAISSGDGASARIDNFGTIQGGVRTGSLDDALVNHAGATIALLDDTIDLGGYSALGNAFTNDGMFVVRGAANTIVMGGVLQAFTNNGTIDFNDGFTDDVLAIHGDFAGEGALRMDVSGLHGTADLLYVDGNVANGSVTTIDVDMLDMPTSATSTITVARVSGDADAAAFVLGDVRYRAGNFLSLAFGSKLTATIDAGNASPDLFSLGVDVTGLNDTGALAAAIAPGAQNLMAGQVGTWRERMVDKPGKHDLGAWVRGFQTQGTIDAALVESNFGTDGTFSFGQKNQGTEIGADFAITEQFSVGALLGKSDARQNLQRGWGSSKLDGDTHGVYATWIAPAGFYVDASYRWMDFDATLHSAAGELRGDGDAEAFNVEAGYAWASSGGLIIEPQLQYTHIDVSAMDALAGGASAFRSEGGTSSIGRAGAMVRKTFGNTVSWTPYASLGAVREFDGRNAYSINGDFFGATSIEGTSLLFETGLTVRSGGWSANGGFRFQDGGAFQSFLGAQASVRYAW